MGIQGFRYMGTKSKLCPKVSEIAQNLPEGAFLDVFSGVASVSTELSKTRNVWANDAELLPYYIAKILFCSDESKIDHCNTLAKLENYYQENRNELMLRFGNDLVIEYSVLSRSSHKGLTDLFLSHDHPGNSEQKENERRILTSAPRAFPFQMFTMLYSNGYFSLLQSVELDSIRYAIWKLRELGELSEAQYQSSIVALCKSASICANTTGHFAQYLTPNERNYQKLKKQLLRSIYDEFVQALNAIKPIGTKRWRNKNRAFHCDANSIFEELEKQKKRPSVIYADPPYTGDQYSRYYHIFRTLILYDYPESAGKGRYPADRFRSSFSLKAEVKGSFKKLFNGVSDLNASLILSYPDNGILENSVEWIPDELGNYFNNVKTEIIPYKHSTFGASSGVAMNNVNEVIYAASQ